jgi:hypothetical protein
MGATKTYAGLVIGAFCILLGGLVVAQDYYLWGSCSATFPNDPGFKGYWKYCLDVSWDVSPYDPKAHGVSHVSILLGLDDCPSACKDGYFAFADTAGSSSGVEGCTVYYYVEFDCKGDPTIPPAVPTIKFEPYENSCEPDVAGTAHVCFYSEAEPRPAGTLPAYVWIKFGPYIEEGTLEGTLPRCEQGTNPREPSTWGSIKALYH